MTERRRFRRSWPAGVATSDPVDHPEAGDLPDQADPFGGSVLESGALWRRRHRQRWRQTDWVDPAQHVNVKRPEAEPAPVSASPMGNRVRAVRKHFLPLPIESVQAHLGGGEAVLHADGPTLAWFFVHKVPYLLLVGGLAVGVGASLRQGWGVVAAVLVALVALVLLVLYLQRLSDRYTAYIITNARMIRMAGVVKQSVESIPWVRVTDIHFEQSPLERVLGYATLHIQSANENTGLAHMSGIGDPEEFNHHLVDMVVAKQGASVPLGRRSDYNVLPPPRGVSAFRRKRRQDRATGSQVVGEPPAPADEAGGAEAPHAGPVIESGPRRLRRRRQVEADPALPSDLSDMASVSRTQMAADRVRHDDMMDRDAGDDDGDGDGRS